MGRVGLCQPLSVSAYPQLRVVDYFKDQMGLPSKASVQNFNEMAFKKLEEFELWAKNKLFCSPLIAQINRGECELEKNFGFTFFQMIGCTLTRWIKKEALRP